MRVEIQIILNSNKLNCSVHITEETVRWKEF